jgi:hypothetical protein
MTLEDSLGSVSKCFWQENNFYINLRFQKSILSSKIGFGYCFPVTSYLQNQNIEKTVLHSKRWYSKDWSASLQRLTLFVSGKRAFFYVSDTLSQNILSQFWIPKTFESIFDVFRCTLSDETNCDMIPRTDLTELPDLGEHAFLGW